MHETISRSLTIHPFRSTPSVSTPPQGHRHFIPPEAHPPFPYRLKIIGISSCRKHTLRFHTAPRSSHFILPEAHPPFPYRPKIIGISSRWKHTPGFNCTSSKKTGRKNVPGWKTGHRTVYPAGDILHGMSFSGRTGNQECVPAGSAPVPPSWILTGNQKCAFGGPNSCFRRSHRKLIFRFQSTQEKRNLIGSLSQHVFSFLD